MPLCLTAALALSACGGPKAPPAPPAPAVDVVTVNFVPVENFVELPGRIEAVRTADVRARVDGIVERRAYEEGADIRAGQVMFRIDPRERRADYEAALATLQRNQATALNASQVVERYKPLVEQQAISKQEYDAAVAAQRTGLADVANAKAQVDRARLTLSYTAVTAPISGRAGRANITEGALVSASAATLMARIEQLDPIYVDFSQSSGAVLELRRQIAAGVVKLPNLNEIPVVLTLEDGTPYGVAGRLNFADMAVDQSTGTVSLRAAFPNAARMLLPGQFVRAKVAAGVNAHGVLVPQSAVAIAEKGASVMVVDANGKAQPRPIQLGPLKSGQWVVTAGLNPDDRVIVEGLQKVRPGSPVTIASVGAKPTTVASHVPQG